jgi:hypothetical protein
MPELDELTAQVKRLAKELDKRVRRHQRVEPYYENYEDASLLPPAVTQARLTKLYRYLMPVAEAPWGSLIVDSKLDRLEVTGLRDEDREAARRVWGEVWQPNWMDSESKLAHGAALLDGRAYATVWPGEEYPDIALDDCTQMVVEFAEGSRRKRTAALRRWKEDKATFATLYRPEGVYKFKGPDGSSDTVTDTWEKREVDGEDWPLPNPFGDEIPVVEIAVNRRLKPGRFPHARGEFEHASGLIDRANLLTFLGLVVAFWMGFPLRGVIGEKIRREVLKDDAGNPIVDEETGKEKTRAVPPFDPQPDSLFQLENPEAEIAEYKAADRKNLSIYGELDQLAVITKTPRHYFPLEQGMSNLSAEAIMASEGGMHAAVTGHKASLGDGWEEVGRLGGKVLDPPVELSPRAEVQWADHESRSLAERADAASKLKDVIPPIAVAELALGATQDQLDRWQAEGAVGPLTQILAAVQSGNGGVPGGVPAGA